MRRGPLRVNVLVVRASDQASSRRLHDLLRERRLLGAESIQVFADVNVKHSVPLANLAPDAEARDLVERGKADALIVTGPATGEHPDVREIVAVRAAVGSTPVLAGSGVTLARREVPLLVDGSSWSYSRPKVK
jgi:predicted TIM-barrel enzyme